LLVGLEGLHVVSVAEDSKWLVVTVESAPARTACPACGVIAESHGRREVTLMDTPCFGRPVRLMWRKRTWCCADPDCAVGSFTERDERVADPRALLTTRACWWAVRQIRREHVRIAGLARQLGTTWNTLWRSIRPLLEAMAADESRFVGVERLGSTSTCGITSLPSPSARAAGDPREVVPVVWKLRWRSPAWCLPEW